MLRAKECRVVINTFFIKTVHDWKPFALLPSQQQTGAILPLPIL